VEDVVVEVEVVLVLVLVVLLLLLVVEEVRLGEVLVQRLLGERLLLQLRRLLLSKMWRQVVELH